MSGRSARARRITSVAAIVATVTVGATAAAADRIDATTPPTTTVAATSAPTTARPTTPTTATPTTAVPTTAPPTTFPGPTPRPAARVASPVDIEKIRATSLPLRRMGIAVAMAVILLAVAGFVYGKVRSRVPTVKVPKLATAGASPAVPGKSPATPLPPPMPIPLPPPVVEDAMSDTVIFEPPPTHHAPEVIAAPADVVDAEPEPESEPEPEPESDGD